LRESDGLAMSSRNQYLSPEERPRAAHIHRTLQAMRDGSRAGRPRETVETEARDSLAAAGFDVDYAALRAPDLTDPGDAPGPRVALIAARLGRTRLIDNLEFTPDPA
jgi:pantoate--beta-alanine ligase